MELDALKASWQKSDKAGTLNPNDIRKMLRNKSNGALNKLIRWEKTCMCLVIIVLPFFWSLIYVQSKIKEFSNGLLWMGIAFSIYCVYSFCSGCYKYKFLKKIDIANMDIITVSTLITKYKKILVYELIFGFCWVIPMLVSVVIVFMGTNESVWIYLFFTAYSIGLLVAAYFILKKFTFNRIRTIQQTINEIEEFEKEE